MSAQTERPPRVPVVEFPLRSAKGHTRWLAACTACTFAYLNVVKSDVAWHAACHRDSHRSLR